MGLLFRRVAAYAVDVALLAAVLIPFAFGLQAVTGYRIESGIGVWLVTVLTISLPAWIYFIVADTSSGGATLGKRLLGVRASTDRGGRVGIARAIARTALKLLPWELTHFAAFALSADFGSVSGVQIVGLSSVYVLLAAYLVVAWRSHGERSVHDLAAGTAVRRVA